MSDNKMSANLPSRYEHVSSVRTVDFWIAIEPEAERDRAVASAARAEGEATGYARAVEEIAAWFGPGTVTGLNRKPFPATIEGKPIDQAIRAKFGGHHA